MTMTKQIADAIDAFEKNGRKAKHVLMCLDNWNEFVKENKLVGWYCPIHKVILMTNYCRKCGNSLHTIQRELPVIEVYGISYQVSTIVKDILIK